MPQNTVFTEFLTKGFRDWGFWSSRHTGSSLIWRIAAITLTSDLHLWVLILHFSEIVCPLFLDADPSLKPIQVNKSPEIWPKSQCSPDDPDYRNYVEYTAKFQAISDNPGQILGNPSQIPIFIYGASSKVPKPCFYMGFM